MGDYISIVREEEFVTIGDAWKLNNFIDLLNDSISVDNQFSEVEAYGQGRGSRRQTMGGFNINGDFSSAVDFLTFGFSLRGVLGGSSVFDIDTADYEHVFWGTEDIPSWVLMTGRQSGEAVDQEFQYYGARFNSVEISFDGPSSISFTTNVGCNYHILRNEQLTPVWADEPVCVGTDTTVQIGGIEVVVNALTVRIENGVVMDQFHLGGRHQGLRHQILNTVGTNIMNADDDWTSSDVPNSPVSDETTITLSDEGGLRWDVDTTESPNDTITNSGSLPTGSDLRPYDRIGFWFYQNVKAVGSELYDFELENAGYTTIYQLDSNDFDAQSWYYIVIDISGDTRDDVDGFRISAPAALTTNFFVFANFQIWDSRKMPVQRRTVSGTIDMLFQNDDQYQRFLDGTTTATAAGVSYTSTTLNIDIQSETLIVGGGAAKYYRMRLDMPRVVYKTPGGPNLSGADARRLSIEFDALWGAGTTSNVYEGTHGSAPSGWDLMASLVNEKALVDDY